MTDPEPVEDWSDVDELDGININRGQGCPHCGADPSNLYQQPAGYYNCEWCGAGWAGHAENASLELDPWRGPAVDGEVPP